MGIESIDAKILFDAIKRLTEENEQLKTRVVPDMSKLTHNELFQLRMLTTDNGANYIVNVVKHIDHLAKLKELKEIDATLD